MQDILVHFRDKTMANKLMYIPNEDTQNNPFCRLILEFETFGHFNKEPTNQKSIKDPKVTEKNLK